jgi:hypothetical protein
MLKAYKRSKCHNLKSARGKKADSPSLSSAQKTILDRQKHLDPQLAPNLLGPFLASRNGLVQGYLVQELDPKKLDCSPSLVQKKSFGLQKNTLNWA